MKAQRCIGNVGGAEWTDGSEVWLFNVPFALVWAGAAAWGVLGVTAPSAVGKISAECCSFSAVSAPIFATKYAFPNVPFVRITKTQQ